MSTIKKHALNNKEIYEVGIYTKLQSILIMKFTIEEKVVQEMFFKTFRKIYFI